MNVALRFEIEDLYATYVAALDERRFDDWPEFFTDECVYKVQPRENHERGLPLCTLSFESKAMLKDRVYGITRTLYHAPYYTRHIVGVPRILETDGDTVRVEVNYLVVRTKRNEYSEVYNAGRYIDVIVREDGKLKFREKVCVFDSEMIPNSLIYPI